MHKGKTIKTQEAEVDVATDPSEPKQRTKRLISRKTDHLERSSESRRMLARNVRVNEFTPKAPSPTNARTPDSKRDKGEPVPRLSFNESHIKPFITYQPIWRNRQLSESNGQSARELPKLESKTERQGEQRVDALNKKVQNLKAELDLRNQQIQVIEEDRQRLRRNNQQLNRNNGCLESDKKQLRSQIENLKQENIRLQSQKKKMEREKETLEKKIVALEKCSSNESWSLQSNRQRYLEREIQELRQRLGKSKSQLQKLLEAEMNRYKEELFNSLKTVSALRINNDCLQKKLHECCQKSETKVSPSDEYMKLRNKYKKFLCEYRTLRKEYDDLKADYDRIKHDKSDIEDGDTSLDLSSLGGP